jgi:uncharacterized protein (DUF2237 family)
LKSVMRSLGCASGTLMSASRDDALNVLGSPLVPCGQTPRTGFFATHAAAIPAPRTPACTRCAPS